MANKKKLDPNLCGNSSEGFKGKGDNMEKV